MSEQPSKEEPLASDMLRKEATACAKHLEEEGLGYSADVVRRCVSELNRLYREHAADMDRMEQAAETIERLTLEFRAASQQSAELRDSLAKYMDICKQLSRELDHLKRRHANLQETVRT